MAVYIQMEARLSFINDLFLQYPSGISYAMVAERWQEQQGQSYSKRSFYRDIQALKVLLNQRFSHLEASYGDLLRYSRAKECFYYVRPGITAFPGFSEKELANLAQTIAWNRHLFQGGLGQGLVQKLQAIHWDNALASQHQELPWPALDLAKEGERSGQEWFPRLMQAIYAQEPLAIGHRGLKEGSKDKIISALPLLLKEYHNGWYSGWYLVWHPIEDRIQRLQIERIQVFALDRVRSIGPLKSKHEVRIPSDFKPQAYFQHLMGLFPDLGQGQAIQRFRLRIRPNSWILNYLEKYPLHPSQVLEEREGIWYVQWDLVWSLDLENFIFSYAQEWQVIAPMAMRESQVQALRVALNGYES